jgi:hypothetical protein
MQLRSAGAFRRAFALRVGVALLSAVPLLGQSKPTPHPGVAPVSNPQPIPFSHKLHAQFVVDCLYCHELRGSGWEMSYPPEAKCLQCHALIKADSPAIKKLNGYNSEKKTVPWVRIYEVPDYVYFSHKVHFKRAKIDCQVCHGPVAERDALSKEKPTSMQSCIDCHKEKGAPVNCRACHER